MAEKIKRNFDTGKLLLVAALLLSLNLIIQLFTVADSVDLSNGLKFSGMGATMTASYLLTAVSMIIVLKEFFRTKIKIKGLLVLNQHLERNPVSLVEGPLETVLGESITITEEDGSPLNVPDETDPLDELVVDEDAEFDSLLDELDEEEAFDDSPGNPSLPPLDEEIINRYKTTKIKIDDETGDVEPVFDDGGLQDLIEQADMSTEDDKQLAKIMAESEIIQTLNELEGIVQELKAKKAVPN